MENEVVKQENQVEAPTSIPEKSSVVNPSLIAKAFNVPAPVKLINDNGTVERGAPVENGQNQSTSIQDGTITANLANAVVTNNAEQKEEVPVEEKKEAEVPTEQTQEAPETVWQKEKQQYIDHIEKLENTLTALKEYEKDPYGFLAKNLPGFVVDTFDPTAYVTDKINKKYNDFQFNPADAYIPNTPSWNYRMDIDEWGREASEIKNNAKNYVSNQEQEAYRVLQGKITDFKTKYGMDDIAFNQKVWTKLMEMNDDDRFTVLAEAIMAKESLNTVKTNIQNSANRANNQLPSLTNNTSSEKPTGQLTETQKLERLFGRNTNGARIVGV